MHNGAYQLVLVLQSLFLSVHLLTVSWSSQVHATSALYPGAELPHRNPKPHTSPSALPAPSTLAGLGEAPLSPGASISSCPRPCCGPSRSPLPLTCKYTGPRPLLWDSVSSSPWLLPGGVCTASILPPLIGCCSSRSPDSVLRSCSCSWEHSQFLQHLRRLQPWTRPLEAPSSLTCQTVSAPPALPLQPPASARSALHCAFPCVAVLGLPHLPGGWLAQPTTASLFCPSPVLRMIRFFSL